MMIRFLSQHCRYTALLLFAVFYADLTGSLYASARRFQQWERAQWPGYREATMSTSLTGLDPDKFETAASVPNVPAGELAKQPVNESPIAQELDIQGEIVSEPESGDAEDIGGPDQPEMHSFRSAGVTDMVNMFSGDFSYNIPLLDLGGYPVNLFYSGGVTMDQDATWVGLGWNLNPGTISRNMRGLPDDFDGKSDYITNTQSVREDVTIGASVGNDVELVGVPLTVSNSVGIFYNNKRGLGLETTRKAEYNPQLKLSQGTRDDKSAMDNTSVVAGLSTGLTINSQNGLSANLGLSVSLSKTDGKFRYGLSTSAGYNSRVGITDVSIGGQVSKHKLVDKEKDGQIQSELRSTYYTPLHYSTMSFARSSFTPSIRMPISTDHYMLGFKAGQELKAIFRNFMISGYMQRSYIRKKDVVQRKPAYGFMHFAAAANDQNAIMDFNRINDGVYTLKSPMISAPVYTYDIFTINGEGTGGSFRGYHGNPAHVKDNATRSHSNSFSVNVDIGAGEVVKVGTAVGGSFSLTEAGVWRNGNMLRQNTINKPSEGLKEGFYFKNPAEKSIIDEGYYNSLGGDQLIRPYLLNTKTPSPSLASGYRALNSDRSLGGLLPINASLRREQRDKRTQAISFLTAEEADLVGLDPLIYSYKEGEFKPGSCVDPNYKVGFRRFVDDPNHYRKRHHISQVNITEPDGRRYVYGVPVYQTKQKEVTFSVEGSPTNRLIHYSAGDNSVDNKKGRDHYYRSEELPGYAHAYLLSAILSPDFVDVTGDGITEDDLGTAVKFNYSRLNRVNLPSSLFPYGANYWNTYKWRMPVEASKAIYNEGLKGDDRDDKGLYTYGEKEIWYLHSIESKNMVACFYISNREDGYSVAGENGGLNTSLGRLKKLDSIRVFTKAEFFEHGDGGKPVKTVHFRYSYKLCPNYPLNAGLVPGETGKLTLDSLWFTYNGHYRSVRNKYVFRYGFQKGVSGQINPSYNAAYSDRWGNYKSNEGNPGVSVAVANEDFPYAEQDPTLAKKYAAAWNLTDILLPSGGTISVEYESDDYAFVQDRRASKMTKIAGFGKSADDEPQAALYNFNWSYIDNPKGADHHFVFFDLEEPLATKGELATRYLQDFKQLLLKLWVKMPAGNVGQSSAYEPVMVYAEIKDYNFVPDAGQPDGLNHSRFYVEMEPGSNGGSAVVQTVFQFLREQLPHRAFPGYEVNGDGPILQVARTVWGYFHSLLEGTAGFERIMRAGKKCHDIDLELSGGRLNDPTYRKRGGGHRVKRVIIGDNWSKLLDRTNGPGAAGLDAWYGQEYDYTTEEEVNGVMQVISSGVASYEPAIGNEENPFREVLQYYARQPLGPTNNSNVELPFAETFFPAASVGYSRVSVRSIHNKTNKRLKSGVGLQQTNFYTTRDFPVQMDYTSFDQESKSYHKPGVISRLFQFRQKQYVTLTQGFRVVLNDMNGKIKSQASFPENDYKTPINFTAYFYKTVPRGDGKQRLDNYVPAINGPDGIVTEQLIGKDIEIMNDYREHSARFRSGQFYINGDFFTVGMLPMILPSFFRLAFEDENRYRSASVLKVVNEYGILDSVINIDKGSVIGTRNLVYDGESGDVLLTRTTNEFKDPVYQFNYPAWWVHSGMEPAYRNLDMIYSGLVFRNGLLDQAPQELLDNLESGDELLVLSSDADGPLETDACYRDGFTSRLTPGTEPLIWAVDIRKDDRNTERQFVFLDRYGVPYNAKNASIRVIRSGKRNMSGASAGSFVSLENPIREVEGIERVVVDNNLGVLNASAVEYREKWRANDQFYAVDTTMVTLKRAPIESTKLYSDGVYTGIRRIEHESKVMDEYYKIIDGPFEIAKKRRMKKRFVGGTRYDIDQRSWIHFNLPSYLEGVTVKLATLRLPGHADMHRPVGDAASDFNIGTHPTGLPHIQPNRDHTRSMTMKISRMVTPWYSDDADISWLSIFEDSYSSNLINDNVEYEPAFVPVGMNFNATYDIPINRLMQGMIQNYGNSMQSSAIKLSFLKPSSASDDHKANTPWRYCFHTPTSGECYKCWGDFVSIYLTYFKKQPSTDYVVYTGPKGGMPTDLPAGYEYYTEETIGKLCFSTFDKKQMNPYIQGVLGNWRGYRSYVFYGERKESDPDVAPNLRKDGQLKDFVHYWSFAEEKLALSGDPRWVWNSEITQYNRKGAELENRDPLDRYNAGIYGYQESLPVAVINNSRLRLSAFDGFEDYAYQDDPCQPYCTPSKRHFRTGLAESVLDANEAHTGRKSMKVAAGESRTIDVPLSADDTESYPDLRIGINRTEVTGVVDVTLNGVGLKGDYYNSRNFTSLAASRTDPQIFLFLNKEWIYQEEAVIGRPTDVRKEDVTIRWTGSLQVERTGDYKFFANIDDRVRMWVKKAGVWELVLKDGLRDREPIRESTYLLAGDLYEVKVEYEQDTKSGYIRLYWQQPDASGQIAADAPMLDVPKLNLYPAGEEWRADNTVETVTDYCEKPDTIQAINHHLIDSFALVPGQKMLMNVWVKKGGEDCNCESYDGISVLVKDEAGATVATLLPKENIIEGWQQMEAVFTVPATGNKLSLYFGAASDGILYVDDLRLHPFNANMKSFVYDAVNLRLMADLDENNFASFYEYDDEGTLIRVKKETRAGIKTITETRSAIQKNLTNF